MLFIIAGFVIFILLQIYLSKREHWFVGLILPIFTFIMILLMLIFINTDLILIIANIIAVFVYLGIYAGCHNKKKNNQVHEINKMNIQDL